MSTNAFRPPAGCAEYRAEMRLLALRRRMTDDALGDGERCEIAAEIRRLEQETGLDDKRQY